MAILKKYIILPLLALNVTGCYTEFEPDIDDSPVLCLNSLISAGEPVDVSVTHTWRYSSGYRGIQRDVTVKNADVALYVNGSNVDDLVYSEEDRKFHSDYVPLSGDTVRIVAFNQTYGSAEASVVVPEAIPIDKVEWDAAVDGVWGQTSSIGDSWFVCEFGVRLNMQAFITDPVAADNYYKIGWGTYAPDIDSGDVVLGPSHIYEFVKFNLYSLDYEWEPLFSEHISVLESVFGSDAYGFVAFSDRQFSGRTYPLHLRFDGGTYTAAMSAPSDKFYEAGVKLSLESISQSYYNWLIYDWQDSDGMLGVLGELGFAEGVVGYSNVSTGAGVVAARSVSTCTVSLADFIKEHVESIKSSM